MDLPDLVLLLIAAVLICVTFVIVVMNRRREHALRDRFVEEYHRALEDERWG